MGTDEKKIKHKIDKRSRRSLCAAFLAVGLAVTGITLAYLTNHDRTTNRASSDYTNAMNIVITEPKWDTTGELDAQKSVAGMEIDKDPYVTNHMVSDVYIRLKIDFIYTDANGTKTTSSWSSDDSLVEYDYKKDNCVVTNENSENTYSRFLSTIYYSADSAEDTNAAASHLLTVDSAGTSGTTGTGETTGTGGTTGTTGTTVASGNPYFYYYDGWFYYMDYDGTAAATALKSLAYNKKTAAPLFTTVKLPVFDDEYNDLFANGFQIKVTAEAVNVAEIDGNTEITDVSTANIVENVFDDIDKTNTNTATASYGSDTAVNTFTPASVSVSVKETIDVDAGKGDGTTEEKVTTTQTDANDLEWSEDSTDKTKYTAKKEVQIHCDDNNNENNTSCYVRVCILPKWCSSVTTTETTSETTTTETTSFEVLDNENIEDDTESGVKGDKNDIIFPPSLTNSDIEFTIDGVTFTLAEGWYNNWIYKDGYFYYKKVIEPGEDTEKLITDVSVSKTDLGKHTDNGESLGVSVLTDAIQSDGGAVEMKWNVTLESGKIETFGTKEDDSNE